MLDTLIILFISVAAMFVAYRAMALNNADDAPAEPEAETAGQPAKPKWATARQRRPKRTKP